MGSGITQDGKLMFPGDYICAGDLCGKDVTVVMEWVKAEMLTLEGGVKKNSCVIKIQGREKKFVANKTNQKAIAKLYGKETLEWPGKSITLYPTKCMLGREEVDCVRIRPAKGNGK